MTYPRAHLIDTTQPGFYHIVSRCVRSSFLCGTDPLTGRSFEHRRAWIESRLQQLASLFSLDVYAYAVMRNHYHIVVRLEPRGPEAWSASEVAARWIDINLPGTHDSSNAAAREEKIQALLDDPEYLSTCRNRLGSLSWYMRFLNHPIACRANQEDDCRGHFWESRYKSFALLDEAAVVACMAYVDLNPIRAGAARSLAGSEHTSIKQRLKRPGQTDLAPFPLDQTPSTSLLNLSLDEYVAFLNQTGLVPTSSRSPPDHTKRARVMSMASHQRAYGARDSLDRWVSTLDQHWFKGTALP